MLSEFILPSNIQLNYNSFYLESGTINCEVACFQIESQCPICKTKSNRIHSKYDRGLVDLPIAGKLSKISLKARKFFCDQVECPRKVFTERFDSEIFPYQRRMARSVNLLEKLGTELGGNRGSNISEYAGIPVSPSTMLRIIRKIEVNPPLSTSGIIGIDDWAFKKGRNYGTVIVDLDQQKIIDLLPNRESTTLAEWLKKYPEITIVSRDRYGPYATGIQTGAPQAKQIADRFHLVKNLTEATKKVLQSNGKILKEAIHLYNDIVNKKQPSVENKELIEKDFTANHLNIDKQNKLEKVKELIEKNLSIQQISKVLQISRGTVRRYANLETYQLKREIKNYTNLDKYLIFIQHDSNKNKTYKQLYEAIVQTGFNGKYSQFCHRMNQNGIMNRQDANKINSPGIIKTWSTSRLSLLFYKEPKKEDGREDFEFLNLLFSHFPEMNQLSQFVKEFKNLFQTKQDGKLKNWIKRVSETNCGLNNFAKNIEKDYEAINNAVIPRYSNGQVEGQVNRIKNIKRMMYGRASFELLRKMILINSA